MFCRHDIEFNITLYTAITLFRCLCQQSKISISIVDNVNTSTYLRVSEVSLIVMKIYPGSMIFNSISSLFIKCYYHFH